MSERTEQLAADVRAVFRFKTVTPSESARRELEKAEKSLHALEARAAEAERQAAAADAMWRAENDRARQAERERDELAARVEALKAPLGFIDALSCGQYAASEETLRAARHFRLKVRDALAASPVPRAPGQAAE